jgi:hypothetical protein
MLTLELRTAQQLHWRYIYTIFLRLSKKRIPAIEHESLPRGPFKLLFMKYHNIWQVMVFATNSVVKYTTGTQIQLLHRFQRYILMLKKTVLSIPQSITVRDSNSGTGCLLSAKMCVMSGRNSATQRKLKPICYHNISTNSVPITYKRISVLIHGEETCKQTGLMTWYFK